MRVVMLNPTNSKNFKFNLLEDVNSSLDESISENLLYSNSDLKNKINKATSNVKNGIIHNSNKIKINKNNTNSVYTLVKDNELNTNNIESNKQELNFINNDNNNNNNKINENNNSLTKYSTTKKDKKKVRTSKKLDLQQILSKPQQVTLQLKSSIISEIEKFYKKFKSTYKNYKDSLDNSNTSNHSNLNINEVYIRLKKHKDLLKKIKISIQSKSLFGVLKNSKLIFITPQIYIHNSSKKDIYIYHINKKKHTLCYGECIREGKIEKIQFYQNCLESFKLSFEDKPNLDNDNLYSGVVKFIKNQEFYLKILEKDKDYILFFIKVYQINGFMFVIIKDKQNYSDYPYFLINNLDNIEVKYKQKDFSYMNKNINNNIEIENYSMY